VKLRTLAMIAGLLALAWAATGEVTVEQRDGSAVVRNGRYVAVLDTSHGATLMSLRDAASGRTIEFTRAGLVVTEERDRPEWAEAWTPEPVMRHEVNFPGKVRFDRRNGAVACIAEWSCPAATVTKTVTFAEGSPVIEVRYALRVTAPLEEVSWRVDSTNARLFRDARVYPADERVLSRRERRARFTPAPALVYLHDGDIGLGVMAGADSGVSAVAHAIEPGPNAVQLATYSPPLRWLDLPADVVMSFRITVGVSPAEALALYRGSTPGLPPVEITGLHIEHMIHHTGEPGAAQVTLSNNSGEPRSVRLAGRIEGAIADAYDLPEQRIDLAAGEIRRIPLQWQNRGEWGFELLVRALDAQDEVLAAAREYFAVADNFSRVGQMTVFNPGWMDQPWEIAPQIEWTRGNYIGTIEYYCWAPDQVFDLTPDTEEFEPHTESQGAYRARLTRTFLRDLVAAAHDAGLRVVAMDTGMAGLDGALRHPEDVKYTADGQIYLYNGAIHDGKRFNAVPANVFTPERIRQWAEEMADSVVMFGWDGVRFDWNFIPVSAQDPLYLGGESEATDEHVWFDWQGRSSRELFPEPDRTAAELCGIWRETVAARHPEFIYHGNYQVDERMLAAFPQYTRTVCADSGILREGLLNVAQRYPTWRQWSEALMETTRIVRPLGGQPSVGWMRGYAPGSVAHRLIHYCMMAAGYHWYGPALSRYSIDDTWLRFRHALRFSEYFYGPGFLPVDAPADVVSLAGEGLERVLWQPFVFRRETAQSHETLVHLLNLPDSDYIIQRHEPPPVRRDLAVTVAVPDGETVSGCALLLPDPSPHAEAVEWQPAGESRVICRIAELREMGSLVVRTQRD